MEVERQSEIEVEGVDCLRKRPCKERFTGLTSAVVQHEIDQLDRSVWPPNAGCTVDPW